MLDNTREFEFILMDNQCIKVKIFHWEYSETTAIAIEKKENKHQMGRWR